MRDSTLKMEYIFDDGGRAETGYKGFTGDCAVRAISIATGKPYEFIYQAINQLAQYERTGKRKRGKSDARTGVYTQLLRKLMPTIGWEWIPTMFIGSGCKGHLKAGELPKGNLVVNVSKHYVAVIDGVIHDTHNPSRGGTRCVYGYYKEKATPVTA